MKITFNAPVVLGFTGLCLASLAATTLFPGLKGVFSTAPLLAKPSLAAAPSLLLHAVGHMSIDHFLGNMVMILLLGPILEEKYGSSRLALMIVVTALVTALVNVLVFSQAVLGASAVVFMMILLTSFAGTDTDGLPLTFVLIALIFLGKEAVLLFADDGVSRISHILGGLTGAAFGARLRPS